MLRTSGQVASWLAGKELADLDFPFPAIPGSTRISPSPRAAREHPAGMRPERRFLRVGLA